jgi:hypothetical protein
MMVGGGALALATLFDIDDAEARNTKFQDVAEAMVKGNPKISQSLNAAKNTPKGTVSGMTIEGSWKAKDDPRTITSATWSFASNGDGSVTTTITFKCKGTDGKEITAGSATLESKKNK